MNALTDGSAFQIEQAGRARKMWAAVVLATLDETIERIEKSPKFDGPGFIKRWANSDDGREVLNLAGVEHSSEAVKGLVTFIKRGIRTSSVSQSKKRKPRK